MKFEKIHAIIIVIVLCALFLAFMVKEFIIHFNWNDNFFLFGIVAMSGLIILIYIFRLLLKKEVNKENIERQIEAIKKSVEVVAEKNDEKLEEYLINKEKFKKCFIGESFIKWEKVLVKNKVINRNGKYIFSKTGKDCAVLLAMTNEQGLLKKVGIDDKELCKYATSFFGEKKIHETDYSRVNNKLSFKSNDTLTKNEEKIYNALSFINNIKA
ncbi:hypothetical protein J2Q11_09860 [Tenacibaculum finnmarkense genomovar finnmarkense]|uniref:hypothetical protein n=1 Tax=Tenacibaculum finnmarkense TaxID=2781243 RepID=UPI001E2CC22C|nr:hypothetical protein [Tenacibaculum finnmarkense]MCD8417966.1 hypothetical protein [Tenacibaculum finnmarkense genomovar finnmarkense]MCG8186353.1 hypothetical protein [Tenacibaculum finnmarkense genomovar finnmarkense]MCG8202916.1 hypothetical protein [Tenacibaculum finnmarkense genomovar finnmarkense]MCG8210154.1 hypothetical protein [Tenacibaculum finnmarkense genomovar finnmarkense]MCG8213197.1 hypothetical protein [Tenacibaculum finnmarkense genomovar finnmarkense]